MNNLRTRPDRRIDAISRKIKSAFSRKTKTAIALVAISFASFAFLEQDVATDVQRRLRCATSGNRSLAGNYIADPCTAAVFDVPEFFSTVQVPNFDIADTADADLVNIAFGTPDNEVDLSPGTEGDTALDIAERGLMNSYDPIAYGAAEAIAQASTTDEGTIAYLVAHTGCSEWRDLAGEPASATDLYEASAVFKSQVCEMTDQATSLGQGEMLYTMHGLVHPTATECPIEGDIDGGTYDRVKLLQSHSYFVEIMGHAITASALELTQPYIAANIENDVGINDSTKLQAWSMVSHPAVVVTDYDIILKQPLNGEINSLLADPNLKGYYIQSPPDKVTGGAGVDTDFMIIKPSVAELGNIIDSYLNTPYDPSTGWNGQGHHDFKGGMGISGFLSYYFANDAGYVQLDRCMYAHTADDDCLDIVNFSDAKAAKMTTAVCDSPRYCPYDHPHWSQAKKEACESLHRTYFTYRYEFEEKTFLKANKQPRIGFFKQMSFLGYCLGPGKAGFLPMTQAVIPQPDWQTVCPPDICGSGGSDGSGLVVSGSGAGFAGIDLGECEAFAMMAGSSNTCAGGFDCDIIQGHLGISPGTSITGNFVANVLSTPDSAGCATDGLAALNAGKARAGAVNMAAEMGGLTFTAGEYTHGSAINIALANPQVFLDAEGDPNAVFIFNAGSTLVTCAHSEIVLLNGARPENVYWILGTALTLGHDSLFVGTILAGSSATINTNGQICGRVIAQTSVTCETACTVGFLDGCWGQNLATFMKPDCSCTAPADPCSACPANTRCQLSPTLMCIDCNCGFCDGGGAECCDSGIDNTCSNSGPGDNASCSTTNDFFPAFKGGDVCGGDGAEIGRTSLPNGCGCKPSSHSPCTYSEEWGVAADKCFICTAADLATGACESCKNCLATCPLGGCIDASFTTEQFMTCLATITDVECRGSCHHECMKN